MSVLYKKDGANQSSGVMMPDPLKARKAWASLRETDPNIQAYYAAMDSLPTDEGRASIMGGFFNDPSTAIDKSRVFLEGLDNTTQRAYDQYGEYVNNAMDSVSRVSGLNPGDQNYMQLAKPKYYKDNADYKEYFNTTGKVN